MEPGVCRVDVAQGELIGATNRYVKTLADLDGLYEDAAAFDALKQELGDAVVYEVTDFKPSANAGDMIIGVTRMRPGKVGREYFLTRGHIHANANRPEMYYGESGRGVMLLELPDGDIRTVEIEPRALCYVPPYWIHRSVNTGPDDLVMTFAYPADFGSGLRDHRRSRRHEGSDRRGRERRLAALRQRKLQGAARLPRRPRFRLRVIRLLDAFDAGPHSWDISALRP